MTEAPISWINPGEAGLIYMTNGAMRPSVASSLDEIFDIFSRFGSQILAIETTAGAPWRNEELVDFLENRQQRQLVVVDDTVSPFTLALSMMAMEIGYDTFLVVADLDATGPDTLSRVRLSGAQIFLLGRFLDELMLVDQSTQV